jgi:hypothetical protein
MLTDKDIADRINCVPNLFPLSAKERAWLIDQLGAGRRLPADLSDKGLCLAVAFRWAEIDTTQARLDLKESVTTNIWFEGDPEDLSTPEPPFVERVKRQFRRAM